MKLVTVKLTHNQLTEQFEYFGETETIDPCFEGVLNIFPCMIVRLKIEHHVS